jgi:hypothetical protein
MSSPIYFSLISLSAVLGLIYFFRHQTHFQKTEVLLLICLFLVFIFEALNHFLVTQTGNKNILYTLSWFYFVPALLIYYFSQQVKQQQVRFIFHGLMVVFFIISVFRTDWQQPFRNYSQYLYFLPIWTMVLLLGAKTLHEILTSKAYADQNILSVPRFWVSIGVVIFFLGSIFMMGILSLFPEAEVSLVNATLNFSHFLGAFMFLIFGFSFFAPILFKKSYKFS